jgi:hypothetical protein
MSDGMKRRTEVTNKEDIKPEQNVEPYATFMKMTEPLATAAGLFFDNYSRPMTLVLDSVDRLAEQKPVFLERLQDFAKDCTDKGHLQVVFISSDGSVLPILSARSAWSRVGAPFEIEEISDSEAVAYLIAKGVPKHQAMLAVDNITGGLFVLLNKFSNFILRGYTYEQVVEALNQSLLRKLNRSEADPNHTFFQYLVAHEKVPSLKVKESGMNADVLTKLVAENVLAIHPADEFYTFHDRHVSRWFIRHTNENTKAMKYKL